MAIILTQAVPPPPTMQPPVYGNPALFTASWADFFFRIQQKLNATPVGSSVQTAIQFQSGGSNLGTSGTVDTLNFTGNVLTVSRVSNTLTVDSKQMQLPELMAFAAAN